MSTNAHRTKDVTKDDARCFIPEILVDFVSRSVRLSSKTELEPASYFFHGVCLLVDISGFTKLSGEFCAQGKSGIDDLQQATNGYMGKLVDVIYEFGGDIIKFAGDAIICVFSSELRTIVSMKAAAGGSIRGHSRDMKRPSLQEFNPATEFTTPVEVVLRAMHCARVLREVQTEKLSVHVAMSCGEMCFGILGGHENHWECLISGPCIHELSDCLDDAPSKQAVISSTCFDILRPHLPVTTHDPTTVRMIQTFSIATDNGDYQFLLEALSSGNHRIISVSYTSRSCMYDAPQVGDALISSLLDDHSQCTGSEPPKKATAGTLNCLLQSFVPVPVAIAEGPAKTASGLSYLAEIREVTTMFMKWDSYNAHGKHRDLLTLQSCFLAAQKILHTSGAFLRQFLVDDKGCVLIACWGVPHMSYMDNALRALSSAAHIRYELDKLQMTCSFGITTGDVYCGTVGSALRMEYAAIGSVVNMSARLMCKANGSVLIDDTTYARIPYTVLQYLHALEPLKVKGRDELLQVYQYTCKSPLAEVKEALIIEDEEVKDEYKTLLLEFLDYIVRPVLERPLNQSISVNRGNLLDFLSNIGTASISTAARYGAPTEEIQVILLEGKEGLSRTSIITWLRKQSTRIQLPTFAVKMTRKDSMLSYALWAKLFQQLMPRDLFLDKATQRRYVRTLLKEVYGAEESQLAESVAFPAMQVALGITCSFDSDESHESGGRKNTLRSYQRPKAPVVLLARRGAEASSLTYRGNPVARPIDIRRSKPPTPKNAPVVVEMTPALILETLKRIFSHLLTWRTVLVILENVHFADAESLQVLVELASLRTRSAIVLTAALNPADEICKSPHRRRPVVPKLLRWVKYTRQRLLECSNTRLVTLQDYTRADVDRMLAGALGVPLMMVPPDVSQLIVDFSGGSFYWMKEILQFIKEHGPDEFLSTIEDLGMDPLARSKRGSLGSSTRGTPRGVGRGTLPTASTAACSSVSPSPMPSARGALAFGARAGAGVPVQVLKSSTSILSLASFGSFTLQNSPVVLPTPMQSQGSAGRGGLGRRSMSKFSGRIAGNHRSSAASDHSLRSVAPNNGKNKFKLEQLVVCRFEKLAAKMQQIFRTASIIGLSFSARVLYGVLPRHLKTDMTECIHSLLAQKWLFQDSDDEYMYHFAHPYLHGVIYELTPTGERNSVHQVIAEYIEETSVHDPSQYVLVSHHYQYCNTDQSLRYAVYAIQHLLRQEASGAVELEDCLDILFSALPRCKTVLDLDVLKVAISQVKSKIYELDHEMQVRSNSTWMSMLGKFFALPAFGSCIANNAARPDAYVPTSDNVNADGSRSASSKNCDLDEQGDEAPSQVSKAMLCFIEQLRDVEVKVKERTDDLLYMAHSPPRYNHSAGTSTTATSLASAGATAGSNPAASTVGDGRTSTPPGKGNSWRNTGIRASTQGGGVSWQLEYLSSVLPKESRLSALLNVDLFNTSAVTTANIRHSGR